MFAWKMLEICGNKILESKDLEGDTPIKLAERRFPGKQCCDKEQGLCDDSGKSDFAKTFLSYQQSTGYAFVGKRNISEQIH